MNTIQKFYAPDGATGAAAEEAVVEKQETDQSAPEFDPSKVDVDNPDALAVLDDEQIAKVSEFNAKKSETGGAPAQADTAKEGEGKPAEAPPAAPVKYAGKYESTDALAQGVMEIAKKLSYPAEAVQAVIDLAKASNDWTKLEAFYKSIEKTLHDKAAETSGPATVPAKADTTVNDTPDEKLMIAVSNLTMSELSRSQLASEMAARNLPLPKNVKEFNDLVDTSPYYAAEFRRAYEEVFSKNLEEAQGRLQAQKSVETANKSVIDSDVTSLKELAVKNGFKLTDEEIEAAKTEALAKQYSYDDKFGVKFLRAGAIKEHFIANRLLDKLAEIKLASEAAGREQAIADLKKADGKTTSSISTSRLGTKTRADAKMPDLSDPDVVAALPDAALNDPEGYYKNLRK